MFPDIWPETRPVLDRACDAGGAALLEDEPPSTDAVRPFFLVRASIWYDGFTVVPVGARYKTGAPMLLAMLKVAQRHQHRAGGMALIVGRRTYFWMRQQAMQAVGSGALSVQAHLDEDGKPMRPSLQFVGMPVGREFGHQPL